MTHHVRHYPLVLKILILLISLPFFCVTILCIDCAHAFRVLLSAISGMFLRLRGFPVACFAYDVSSAISDSARPQFAFISKSVESSTQRYKNG